MKNQDVSAGRAISALDATWMLKVATQCLFVTIVLGQWLFVLYLSFYYIGPALRDGLQAWGETSLVTGFVPGDNPGNLAVATHIFLALIIIGLGPFQIVPKVRAKYPTYHRWFGRVYLFFGILASFAGLYMVWVRGNPQAGVWEHIGTSIGAVLIPLFAMSAWKTARRRDFVEHRRWALRLFMVMSGVWFIRIGYGLWFVFEGTAQYFQMFSIFVSYAQYLLPLAVLELYFHVQRRGASNRGKFMAAGGLWGATILTAIGVYGAATVMWLPRVLHQ